MIWIIEHCCIGVKACDQNTMLGLCCRHSGWVIVLQSDAAQMGKCCDPLECGMSTSTYSIRFCLISSNTIMWNIYDEERSTWIKFIKLHTKSRQSFGQRFCRKVFFISIQPVKPQKYEWLGCIGTKGGDLIGITTKYWLYSLCTCTWFKWLNTVVVRWKHVSRTLSQNCVVITVPETLFYTLMQFKRAKCCDVLEHWITLHTTEEFKHGT